MEEEAAEAVAATATVARAAFLNCIFVYMYVCEFSVVYYGELEMNVKERERKKI